MATSYEIWNQLPPGYKDWLHFYEIVHQQNPDEPMHKIKHLHANGDIKIFCIDSDYMKARVLDELQMTITSLDQHNLK